MRRALFIAALLAVPSTAIGQFAPQTWSADQDGANFICADVGYFQANNLTGAGTGFACTDPTGKIVRSATACVASGAAYYQTVQDAALGVLPQEPILGIGRSGGTLCATDDPGNTLTNLDMCAIGNINVGGATKVVNSFSTNVYGQAIVGASSGLGPSLTFSGGNLIDQSYEVVSRSTNAPVNAVNLGALASGVLEQTVAAGVSTPTVFASGSARVPYGSGSNGQFADAQYLKWNGINPGLTSLEELQIYNDNSSSTGLTGIRIGTSAAFTQNFSFSMIAPGWSAGGGLVAGDVLAEENAGTTAAIHFSNFGSAGTIDFDTGASRTKRLIIDSSGYIEIPVLVAPSTPGASLGTLYVDSTSKNIALKNDAGTVNHGIQTQACAANQWINSVSDAGGSACVQPAFTNLSGSQTCAQRPAETGDVTSPAGSCATTAIGLHDGASAPWTYSGTWAASQVLVTAASSHVTTESTQTLFTGRPAMDLTYYLELTAGIVTTIATGNQEVATSSSSIITTSAIGYPIADFIPEACRISVLINGSNTITSGTLTFQTLVNNSGSAFGPCAASLTSASSGTVSSGLSVYSGSPATTDNVGLQVSPAGTTPVVSGTLRVSVRIRISPELSF